MEDEFGMGGGDGFGDIADEPNPGGEWEGVRLAVGIDRLAFDTFHDHPGVACGGGAAVENFRKAGVVEVGEDLALGAEAGTVGGGAAGDELEGAGLFEAAFDAGDGVDAAHAAAAENAGDLPGAEAGAVGRIVRESEGGGGAVEEAGAGFELIEEGEGVGGERGVAGRGGAEVGFAPVRWQVEAGIHQAGQLGPVLHHHFLF